MDKRFLSILAVIILIFVGIFIFNKSDKNGGNNSGSSSQATSHFKGANAKNVTLTEYGDYQCPVCLAYEPVIQQVVQANSANMRFQFKNLPLPSHPNAYAAARTAEAADLQDKFWEMHDLLYEPANWSEWTSAKSATNFFEDYAKQLGLDVERFKQDFESSRVNDLIRADISEFNKTGQQMGTPSFFLNGRHIANQELGVPSNIPGQLDIPASAANFQKLLDAEYNKKQ